MLVMLGANKPQGDQRCCNKFKHALGHTTNKPLIHKFSSQGMIYHPFNILQHEVLWPVVLHIAEHVADKGNPGGK